MRSTRKRLLRQTNQTFTSVPGPAASIGVVGIALARLPIDLSAESTPTDAILWGMARSMGRRVGPVNAGSLASFDPIPRMQFTERESAAALEHADAPKYGFLIKWVFRARAVAKKGKCTPPVLPLEERSMSRGSGHDRLVLAKYSDHTGKFRHLFVRKSIAK